MVTNPYKDKKQLASKKVPSTSLVKVKSSKIYNNKKIKGKIYK